MEAGTSKAVLGWLRSESTFVTCDEMQGKPLLSWEPGTLAGSIPLESLIVEFNIILESLGFHAWSIHAKPVGRHSDENCLCITTVVFAVGTRGTIRNVQISPDDTTEDVEGKLRRLVLEVWGDFKGYKLQQIRSPRTDRVSMDELAKQWN